MGFFDAIKSAVNFVTGGGAKVEVQVGPRAADGGYPIHIEAVAAEAELKINKVYMKVEGHETIKFKHTATHASTATQPTTGLSGARPEEHTETATTFSLDVDVAPGTTLAKGQNYTWDTVLRLPADVQPTYAGTNARHEWRVCVALDAAGTDPSSAWVIFKV